MAAVPDRARQAFRILQVGFVVAPILAGLDKFFEVLVDWDRYLAPVATDVLPVSGHSFMLAVGVIEIAAGVLVAFRPRIGGYVVAVWLWAIILNLLVAGDFFDFFFAPDGLLTVVRTEAKGKQTRELCAATDKGLRFLLEQVSPKQVLEDFKIEWQKESPATDFATASAK